MKKPVRERQVGIIIRIHPDLREALRKIAADNDRSVSMQVVRYIKRGVEDEEKPS